MYFSFSKRSEQFYLLLLLLAGIIIYFPSMFISFFGDEPAFILRNSVSSVGEWFRLLDKKIYDGAYYRPLGNLISGTITLLFGDNEWLYRLFNLLLHSLNGIIVFKFTSMLLRENANKSQISLLAALLFIVFPLHDLAVIWHTDLFDRLLVLFYLLAIYNYLAGKQLPALIFTLLSFLTKEMSFSLPAVIIISGYFVAGYNKHKLAKDAILYFGVLLVIIAFRYIVFGNYLFQSDLTHPDAGISGIVKNLVYFGGLLIFPFDSYNIKEFFNEHTNLIVTSGSLFVLMLGFLIFRDKKNWKIYLYLVLFFFLTIAPASRLLMKWYLYLPSIGFIILFSMALHSISRKHLKISAIMLFLVLYSGFLLKTEINWISLTHKNDEVLTDFQNQFSTEIGKQQICFLTVPAKISGYPINHLNPAELFRHKLGIDNNIEILSRSEIENWSDKIDCFRKKNDIRLEHKFPNFFILYGYEDILQYDRENLTQGKLTDITIKQLPDSCIVFSYSENKYFRIK